MKDNEFWRGKRVLVTGHTGFKGGWLSLWLKQSGAKVCGFALAPDGSSNFFTKARISDGITSLIGDLRDRNGLEEYIRQTQPEVIFHLAAQSLVKSSYIDPIETYSTNVIGTAHLLNALRDCPSVKVVVVVTSDKCYENREYYWGYRETDPLGGHDPYSSSKACVEVLTSSFRSSYFSDKDVPAIATVRAGNVIGGGDWSPHRLVPDLVRAFSRGESACIRNSNSTRPWQHVLEPLNGYLILAEALWNQGSRFAQAWNFGPNDHDNQTVGWVVNQFVELWGEGAKWKLDCSQHAHEAKVLRLDCSKVKSELAWAPKWNLQNALSQTVAWYKADLEGKDMREFSIRQLSEFLEA